MQKYYYNPLHKESQKVFNIYLTVKPRFVTYINKF